MDAAISRTGKKLVYGTLFDFNKDYNNAERARPFVTAIKEHHRKT